MGGNRLCGGAGRRSRARRWFTSSVPADIHCVHRLTSVPLGSWYRWYAAPIRTLLLWWTTVMESLWNGRNQPDVGSDLIIGSLIKNPGGGIAQTGGYIAGRRDLVEQCSYRLTCVGMGKEVGCTLNQSRPMFMGLFSGRRGGGKRGENLGVCNLPV